MLACLRDVTLYPINNYYFLFCSAMPEGYRPDVVRQSDLDKVHDARGMMYNLNSRSYISFLIDHSIHIAIRDEDDNLAAYEFVYNTGENTCFLLQFLFQASS